MADQHVSHLGEGLTSIYQVEELSSTSAAAITVLNLHGNNVARIEGLNHLSRLARLNLSSNCIQGIENLQGLASLTSLNLASNRLRDLRGLAGLTSLVELNVSYNYITSLDGIAELHGPAARLKKLNVQHNALASLQALAPLAGCLQLRSLLVGGNPCTVSPAAYAALRQVLPQVQQLDEGQAVSVNAGCQLACLQLQVYQDSTGGSGGGSGGAAGGAGSIYAPGQASTSKSPQRARQMVGGDSRTYQHGQDQEQLCSTHAQPGLGAPKCPAAAQHLPPWLVGAAYQENCALVNEHGEGLRREERTSSGKHQQRARRQRQNHEAQIPGSPARFHKDGSDSSDGSSRGGDSSTESDQGNRRHSQHHRQRQRRHRAVRTSSTNTCGDLVPASASTATQTQDVFAPTVDRLQAEAQQLRKELSHLADELEASRASEQQLRQRTCEAIRAAEAEAHRSVEDSYQEASFAVHKALERVDAAVAEAAEAQGRAKQLEMADAEARAELKAAREEISRLRDEATQHSSRLEAQLAATARAAAEESERQKAAERVLQQRLQDVAAELAVAQAAARTAEQQVASLEAALQRSSAAAMSMTEKVAQAMGDAGGQVEAIKAKLSATEAKLAEAQASEAARRADAQAAREALEADRKLHREALEAAQKLPQEALEAARKLHHAEVAELKQQLEVAVAQARRQVEAQKEAAAAMAQEHAASQEQVAFLRGQLQYALHQSEEESLDLQRQLAAAQAESASLRDSLRAAGDRSAEQERLVVDLSQTLQQQKTRLQSLQRDCEDLRRQLARCTPSEFERLHSQLMVAQRAAAEVPLVQDQLARQRQLWQGAEERLAKLQVARTQLNEEAAAKAAALEAQLKATRDEVARLQGEKEALEKQLEAARDAVQVKAAMVDSAHQSIAQLKAELSELQAEADDARAAADSAERRLIKVEEASAGEAASLRADLEASRSALTQLQRELTAAKDALREEQAKGRAAQDAVAEKDAMITFVEEEVSRVKVMFESKEARLRTERDTARRQLEATEQAREALEAQVGELRSRLEGAVSDAERQRRTAAQAAAAQAAAEAAATAAQESAARADARVAEVEREMAGLLSAVEAQKAASAAKMRQLASLLHEM